MKFANLYNNNRKSVERAIRAMWCGESCNESQQAYAKQLAEIIKNLFAPKDAVPVVQCMNSYESVHSVAPEEAKSLVGQLWTSTKFQPYEHQYQSWKALLSDKTEDGKPLSICVTTGTGSGKTECFMMPLVKDLIDHPATDQIQALFLYPLNALMEDQKERLEELLRGTELTYTVYNGDLPEYEPKADDTSKEADALRRRIAQIRGEQVDKDGQVSYKFPRMVYTRKEVRKNPPNILLTNPTMLEYILLRDTDKTLTNPALKSLKWVAIDETHTYTGAGAAELAMLLRRVLLAFGVSASDIHFATSSATFGNGENAEMDLREFIAGITGTETEQVKVIGGVRTGKNDIHANEDCDRWTRLFRDEYVSLGDLFPGESSVSEKLDHLDAMCERVPKDVHGNPILKAKVHYFYRVPNNGLFVRLTEHENGAFKIYTTNSIDDSIDNETPLLELSRCKHCGEYVALAKINQTPGEDFGKYEALDRDDSDMFDLEEDDDAVKKYAIIGLSRNGAIRGDNNIPYQAIKNKLVGFDNLLEADGGWHLMANTHCQCPYCSQKLTKKKGNEDDTDNQEGEMNRAYLQKFRLSSDFISRFLAPSILDQLDKNVSSDPEQLTLHDGQQFISFADSRQLAAKATLKQNLEQERMWFYSTIYHELCRRKAKEASIKEEIKKVRAILSDDCSEEEYDEAEAKLRRLRDQSKGYLTWRETAALLKKDKYCRVFCTEFVKRSSDSEEMNHGSITPFIVEKYIQSIMALYLIKRPTSAGAPETMGLFHSHYQQLSKIKLPAEVAVFNDLLTNEENKIGEQDWRNLLQIFMDYHVRSNESVFLRLADDNPIDINACQRFAIEKPHRRPVKKPTLEKGKTSTSRIVKYLCALIAKEQPSYKLSEIQTKYFEHIDAVINALWNNLTNPDYLLLERSQHWDEDQRCFSNDSEGAWRLNLANMGLKLYDEAWLCDTNNTTSLRHAECLRPVENNFKGFSPYLQSNEPVMLDMSKHEVWEYYPYYEGSGTTINSETLTDWAKTHRSILWENNLWGEEGVFSDRLEDIHLMPNLFIQAEHTAQVDKMVARDLQTKFKAHSINILACSTTMEMGVDLGNLEVVVLTSVPPQPSNYKQRAGRSGRNNKVRSVCITLCGSDAIGLRTLFNPLECIINREVKVPTVDLMSPQVVQRHANSYLVRAFGVFSNGENGGKLTQCVVDYYTNFKIEREGTHLHVIDSENNPKSPADGLGDENGTMYAEFNKKCSEKLDVIIRGELEQLLRNTLYDGHIDYVVKMARKANERCYEELSVKIDDYKAAFSGASPKFATKLKMQYMEVMNTRLLNYWATSRFTPNANMPVSVLTLDINTTGKKDFYSSAFSSNPSYGLREAISQYAPGNTIVVDGVSYIVRGIEYANMYQGNRAFKQIYRNNEKCVIDDPSISDKKRWDVTDKDTVELIQPVGFIPDMNEEKSRIMETNTFTRVSAQLIDTEEWHNSVKEPHLFSVRSNRDTGNAKILYYNEGLGYGYCFCRQCGRMVLENCVADGETRLEKMPEEMNPKQPKDPEKPKYHHAISGADYRSRCGGSTNADYIHRNVIIGDLVQTDYAEIRLRHKGKKHWISSRGNADENMLFTLGIVFTQTLADILGKERSAVDFAIMPNGHICVFDTNPGGAGYANQMASVPLMSQIITQSKTLLLRAKARNSKDMLLDKFTLRFMKYVDIDKALAWIYEEEDSCAVLPAPINTLFPTAHETSLVNLERAFEASSQLSVLFVNTDYESWDYEGEENGWRNHLLSYFNGRGSLTEFCVLKSEDDRMPEPAKEMCRGIKAWVKRLKSMINPYISDGIYPLAYIDDVLYFTNDEASASLNSSWGNKTIYCQRMGSIHNSAVELNCDYTDSTIVFKLEGDAYEHIHTKELGEIIQNKATNVIAKFLSHCKQSSSTVKIEYQDEHLKSVLGMIMTLQVIEYFVKQIGRHFTLDFLIEEYNDSSSKNTITANLLNAAKRDESLKNLTYGWLNDLQYQFNIEGEIVPIHSANPHSLTHWRVLSFECDGKKLSIYPDGGFANGWNIEKNRTINRKFYQVDNTDTTDNIGIYRNQDIKFDVTIE